jgi:hypothetical protein
MRIFNILLLILFIKSGFAQSVRGIIEDSLTGEKISYATIYLKNLPTKGCYSNAEGFFSISCCNSDTFCISAIGYKKTEVSASPIIDESLGHYRLIRENKPLPDVVITSKKCTANCKLSLGFHKNKKEISFPGTLGGKIIVFIDSIPIEGHYIISNLCFSIAKPYPFYINDGVHGVVSREKYSKGLVRVLLYDADTANNAGNFKSLLSEDIICLVALKNYLLKVDVTKFRIPFPDKGVYVGLEWLGEKNSNVDNNLAPECFESKSIKYKKLNSFYGSNFYDPFEKSQNKSPSIRHIPNFGVELVKTN